MYNPQLETFIRVADAGSFNKAAEQAYITPTAVIKQINALEAEIDVKLFARTHRGLKLTAAGASLYNDAKYIIQYCREAAIRAQTAMRHDVGVIRIGASPLTPAQILVELWPKIHALRPEIKFKIIPFANTPENAKEILKNLGQNIDLVTGIFDDTMLNLRNCSGLELTRLPLCCAVSVNHRLAGKNSLSVRDLYGERLMLPKRGWSASIDELREDLRQNHEQISVTDFDFYNTETFNSCENSNNILLAVKVWDNVHPLLKIIPVDWRHTVPYGLLHSPAPSPAVTRFLTALRSVLPRDYKPKV